MHLSLYERKKSQEYIVNVDIPGKEAIRDEQQFGATPIHS
jgi:hypothetical protein